MPSDRPEILFEVTENTGVQKLLLKWRQECWLFMRWGHQAFIWYVACLHLTSFIFAFSIFAIWTETWLWQAAESSAAVVTLCSRSMQQLFMDISGCLRKPCCWPKHQHTNQQLHWDFKSWQPSNFQIAATTFINEDYACLQTVRWTDLGKICMCGICYLDIKHLDWLLVYTVCEST